MKNIVRNFSVAIVVFVTTFITVYYSVVYATKKQIVFDGSDILIIIFFGLLSLMVVFMLLYINSKLNSFSNALSDISNKIDISEENMINLEKSIDKFWDLWYSIYNKTNINHEGACHEHSAKFISL